MSTIKVTPEQLHHVSNQVDQARQQLEYMQQDLARHIMFLQTMWLGVTQENFYRQFTQARPVLQKALESMTYTSQDLNDIATRFENADAETGSIGGVLGVAVGASTMMMNSGADGGSEDKGYRMAQVNMFGRYVWLPVNENGVTDQAALQAYKKDHGHVDFNRMQAEAVKPEEPEEDIYALQIKAFENRTHPFTGEPVSDRYAKMMITSLKYSQLLMAFQMVRGSIPGRKGPFHFSASDPAVAKIKKNIEEAKARKESKSDPKGTTGSNKESSKNSSSLYDKTGNYTGGRTKKELDDLARDPSHGFRIEEQGLKEREIGLELERRGTLGIIVRDPQEHKGAEFIDTKTGIKWDVKSFESHPIGHDGLPITKARDGAFKVEKGMSKLNTEFDRGHNVIIDTRKLTAEHVEQLKQSIDQFGVSDRIIWYP